MHVLSTRFIQLANFVNLKNNNNNNNNNNHHTYISSTLIPILSSNFYIFLKQFFSTDLRNLNLTISIQKHFE